MQKFLTKETIIESARIILFFTIIQYVIQIARGVIFARLLGPSEYGVFTLAFFFIPFIVTFAKLGIPSSYERYVHQYEIKGELRDFFKKTCLLTVWVSVFFTFCCLLFPKQISEILYASTNYKSIIILCALTVPPYVLYENFMGFFNGLRIFKISNFLVFSQFFIYSILGIVLVLLYRDVKSIVVANLVSFIIVSLAFGFIIWKYILSSNSQNSTIKENNFYSKIFRYSTWFVVTPVMLAMLSYTDRFLLNRFTGLREVGVYSVAMNFTGILFMFGNIVGRVLLPSLSKIWEQNQRDRAMFMLNFTTKVNTLILLGAYIVLVLLRKPVMSLLYGSQYLEGTSVIGLLAVYWIYNSIFWIIKGYGELIEKTYFSFIGCLIGLPVSILLNYLLIPRYNMIGAAIASTVTFAIILTIIFALNNKSGMKIDYRTVLVCLLPGILILDNMGLIVSSLIVIVLIFKSELILDKHEKSLFCEQLKKAVKLKQATT
ncbi:MAG: oligosaccharide flippase family protein [Nitrospirae bacterium]|nr:oligosaccharide flippase family protein [Nitrospirota bacterium]